jgi:hypothetical protein
MAMTFISNLTRILEKNLQIKTPLPFNSGFGYIQLFLWMIFRSRYARNHLIALVFYLDMKFKSNVR